MTVSLTKEEVSQILLWINFEHEDGAFAVEGTDNDTDMYKDIRKTVNSIQKN